MFAAAIACALLASPPPDQGFLLRVIDCGPGLATVARIPDADSYRYVVYDTGHWSHQPMAMEKFREVIPAGEKIDWLILSHTDGDHIAVTDELLFEYDVKRIVWPNNWRDTAGWRAADKAIDDEKTLAGAIIFRPEDREVRRGMRYRTGEGMLQFIHGKSKPRSEWGFRPGSGEFNNSGSVVVAIEYAGKRILLAGDAVGRDRGGPANQCIATEAEMVNQNRWAPLRSDVIVAPHHGGDNGSSTKFIRAVAPKKVIFSAGHAHDHPTAGAAGRYIGLGLNQDTDIFRTDVGDREGGFEWGYWPAALGITSDKPGRDDVDVRVGSDGTLTVAYRAR